MYKKSSGSQCFRTTTRIKSGPDAFDESRFVMTFLTILGVIVIMQSQISPRTEKRERDTQVIKIKVLRKVLSN